jgi:thiosulfate/3-mercaptopyruvate sulfurtransferase
MSRTLIDVTALAARLDDPDLVIVDCRFDLTRPQWGESAYADSHLPGARYAHLDRDLSGPVGPATGRHPLPSPEAFAARAGAWGIGDGIEVVAYDQGNGMYAARLWWLLRWLGHADVAVLDGGFAAWRAAGLALETPDSARPVARAPRNFIPRPDRSRWLDVTEAMQARDRGVGFVDARAADRFAGENESIDPVAGHVPGAVNHPFARNLEESGKFLAPATLRARWTATLAGRSPAELVAMCGSGVSACHNLLALEHAGLPGARLYAGSWSEWIRDPARPVARGPD